MNDEQHAGARLIVVIFTAPSKHTNHSLTELKPNLSLECFLVFFSGARASALLVNPSNVYSIPGWRHGARSCGSAPTRTLGPCVCARFEIGGSLLLHMKEHQLDNTFQHI